MSELTKPLFASVRSDPAIRSYPSADPDGLPVSKLHFAVLAYVCAGLIAAHLLVIAFAPRFADSIIYPIWAAAVFTYGSIAFMQARSTHGILSLRWLLFALSLGCISLNYFSAAAGLIFQWDVPRSEPVLLAASATLLLLGITLPADSRSRGERFLNTVVAVVFCAVRFFFEVVLNSGGPLSFSALAHYTFDPVAALVLAFVAMAASSQTERRFFRNLTLYLAADFLAGICINQVSKVWLHQKVASPWELTGTIVPLAAGIYLLGNLTTTHAQSRIHFREPERPVLRALVPYAIYALIVCQSLLLRSVHRYIADAGIAFAVAALFARIAFTARNQSSVEQSLRYALRNQSWQDGPDPLNKVEIERDFGPALWEARSAVGRETPLSLLLLDVEEAAENMNVVESGTEGDYLIDVARHLCQWRPTYAKLYYLGQSRFAMLLPATSSRSAIALASRISTGIEALGLLGRRGFVRLSVGTSTALVLSEADGLVEGATRDLNRPKLSLRGFFTQRTGTNPSF